MHLITVWILVFLLVAIAFGQGMPKRTQGSYGHYSSVCKDRYHTLADGDVAGPASCQSCWTESRQGCIVGPSTGGPPATVGTPSSAAGYGGTPDRRGRRTTGTGIAGQGTASGPGMVGQADQSSQRPAGTPAEAADMAISYAKLADAIEHIKQYNGILTVSRVRVHDPFLDDFQRNEQSGYGGGYGYNPGYSYRARLGSGYVYGIPVELIGGNGVYSDSFPKKTLESVIQAELEDAIAEKGTPMNIPATGFSGYERDLLSAEFGDPNWEQTAQGTKPNFAVVASYAVADENVHGWGFDGRGLQGVNIYPQLKWERIVIDALEPLRIIRQRREVELVLFLKIVNRQGIKIFSKRAKASLDVLETDVTAYGAIGKFKVRYQNAADLACVIVGEAMEFGKEKISQRCNTTARQERR